jgi:hypothetical protein
METMIASLLQEGATTPMTEKYIPVIELLEKVPMIDDAGKKSPRNKSAFLALLRRRFKLNILMVTFPGKFNGRAVAAITDAQAKAVQEALTKPHVVSSDAQAQ